ncbi:DUF3488 domain-containing protein [Myxococcus sp. K38C18041901]|uniref:DUF3488 domain-containing protein n=1 Tax=Myxococcus guangdongensis TaxID=2906760 RepID=UPI0020A7FEDE|nr:DUF3488 domain-containing protein [Myxococcus guangdongensis]MCP3063159.1 DUF3488 domain-containing protein [Myxococcus guangdongensis]
MDGGLAVFGFGVFLLSIAGLFDRTAYGMVAALLVLSVVAMGMAFSESKRLRDWAAGFSIALFLLGIVALVSGTVWWLTLGTFLFAAAFGVLWAEFRFSVFGNVRQQDLPVHHARRMNVHWPWHRRRSVH